MAKGKARENVNKSDFAGFVNIPLQDVDKERLSDPTSDLPDLEALFAWVGTMSFEGYRFSFSWDTYSQAMQIAMYCWDEESPNYAHAVSARHPDLDVALLSLWYKHVMVCEGVWDTASTPPALSWQ